MFRPFEVKMNLLHKHINEQNLNLLPSYKLFLNLQLQQAVGRQWGTSSLASFTNNKINFFHSS